MRADYINGVCARENANVDANVICCPDGTPYLDFGLEGQADDVCTNQEAGQPCGILNDLCASRDCSQGFCAESLNGVRLSSRWSCLQPVY